jgi:tetratricopeptide (TPR) repeat protein
VGEPGAYRLARSLEGLQVPATVQAVLAARIDRLPPEEKRLLQTAAVIGTDVPFALLQGIADVPEEALHRGLAHLQAVEFLYETRLFPEQEYTFMHALTHEVAYGSLLQVQRRALHVRIVEAIEAPERGAEQVERLAHHALRGEVWDKAVTYCQQAGARAHDRAALREALASFEQALQALEHLHEDSNTRALAIELRLALGGVLQPLGEYGRCLALLGEAEVLARELDDRPRTVRVLSRLTQVLRITGDLDGAIARGQQVYELAAMLGENVLQMRASFILGEIYYVIGDFRRAAELLRHNVKATDRECDRLSTALWIDSQAWLARTLSMLGAFAEGRRHGEEALRLAMLEGREETPITAHACLGSLYLAQGDLEHAVRVLEQGLVLCRASGNRSGFLRVMVASLGYAAALQGRLAEGRMLLEEAIGDSVRIGARKAPHRVAWFSEVCRRAGRSEEAWQHAREALDLARQQQVHGEEALALHQLGVVQAHAAPPDTAQAEAHYRQALVLAEELNMRPLQAHCHHGLGRLYHQTGRAAPARAALTTAIDLYRAMDMTLWLPQAEAALAQVEGQ